MPGPPFRTAAPLGAAVEAGYQGWSTDPSSTGSSQAPTSGDISVVRVAIVRARLITNIGLVVIASGVTLTAGQNFCSLLDDNGNKLSDAADQTVQWASTGEKVAALNAATMVPPGFVRVAILTVGVTPPGFATGAASVARGNLGLSGAAIRYGIALSGQTTIPAAIDVTSMTKTQPFAVVLT